MCRQDLPESPDVIVGHPRSLIGAGLSDSLLVEPQLTTIASPLITLGQQQWRIV
jgi:hypothetical protein